MFSMFVSNPSHNMSIRRKELSTPPHHGPNFTFDNTTGNVHMKVSDIVDFPLTCESEMDSPVDFSPMTLSGYNQNRVRVPNICFSELVTLLAILWSDPIVFQSNQRKMDRLIEQGMGKVMSSKGPSPIV